MSLKVVGSLNPTAHGWQTHLAEDQPWTKIGSQEQLKTSAAK
jgi:hypothetical protein